jgi:hypothetical protein
LGKILLNDRTRIANIFIITLCAIFFLSIGLHVHGRRSEGYKYAIQFISNNNVVQEKVGDIKRHSLALMGYNFKQTGPHVFAEYKINIAGTVNKGVVYIAVEKLVGVWSVKKANLLIDKESPIQLAGS